jgi:hypothetical protein
MEVTMTRLLNLLTISLFAFAMSAGAQEPPKPPKPPKPGQADPTKKPTPPKRSFFCTDKSDGWYCGENNEPKLFLCRSGFIEDGKDCPTGCDAGRNRCKTESK